MYGQKAELGRVHPGDGHFDQGQIQQIGPLCYSMSFKTPKQNSNLDSFGECHLKGLAQTPVHLKVVCTRIFARAENANPVLYSMFRRPVIPGH